MWLPKFHPRAQETRRRRREPDHGQTSPCSDSTFVEQQNIRHTESLVSTSKPCVFCQIVAGKVPAEIVVENNDALAFLDHRPLQIGHVLLIPKPHIETLEELSPERSGDFFK